MPRKIPDRDPIATNARQSEASRRTGNRQCSCGETRPHALVPNSNPTVCARCQRLANGRSQYDNHHPAGESNDPTTIPIDVNDHRADLSSVQQNWPKLMLQNPTGSPIVAMAARIQGFLDTLSYLIDKLIGWIPDVLMALSAFLEERLGPKWWVGTPLEKFAPRR